jgi:hypothetical protein
VTPSAIKPGITEGSYRQAFNQTQPNAPAGGGFTNDPTDGSYDWGFFDSALAQAQSLGINCWLRLLVGADTPGWVRSQCVVYVGSDGSNYPIWWDANYVAALTAIIQAMGTRYASNPRVTVFDCNAAQKGSGDWTVPNATTSWTLTQSLTCPAFGATGTTTSATAPFKNWVGTLPGFGWFQVTAVTGSAAPYTVTIKNLGINGNASSGTINSGTVFTVNDVANLTGPVYGYTTTKFVNAVTNILAVAHAAFPNQVINQEVGRTGTLDPYPNQAQTKWSQLQAGALVPAGSNPYTCTFSNNVAVGSLLIIFLNISSSAASITGFTDNLNNVQWLQGGIIQAQNRTLACYYLQNQVAGKLTVTMALAAASGAVNFSYYEFSGPPIPFWDVANTNNGGTTTTVTTPTITPAFASDLVLAALAGAAPLTGEAGWTFQSHNTLATQFILPASAAPISATFGQGSAGYASLIIAFKSWDGNLPGTTFQYHAATRIAQWAYANIPAGKFAIEKDTFNAQTPSVATALAGQDGSSFYLPAQTVAGSSNTSGTTGTIPAGSMLNGQWAWYAYDSTGQYSPESTASAQGPYTANGGVPYSNPFPVWAATVAVLTGYGCVRGEPYDMDLVNVYLAVLATENTKSSTPALSQRIEAVLLTAIENTKSAALVTVPVNADLIAVEFTSCSAPSITGGVIIPSGRLAAVESTLAQAQIIVPGPMYWTGAHSGAGELWPLCQTEFYSLGQVGVPADPRIFTDPVRSVLAGISLRQTWSQLEYSQGNFNYDFLDSEIDRAVAAGLDVELRILVQSGQPSWLKNLPVQWFYPSASPQKPLWPYWDPQVQPLLWNMYDMLGQRYAAVPNIKIFAIAGATYSSGDWGVPHLAVDCQNWVRNYGYTSQRLIDTVVSDIQHLADAFPNAIVYNACGRNGTLDPTDNGILPNPKYAVADYCCEKIIQQAYQLLGKRFRAGKNQLNAIIPFPAQAWGSNFQILYEAMPLGDIGGQSTWWNSGDTTYRNNAGKAPPNNGQVPWWNYVNNPPNATPVNATILAAQLARVAAYRMKHYEIYQADATDLWYVVAYSALSDLLYLGDNSTALYSGGPNYILAGSPV